MKNTILIVCLFLIKLTFAQTQIDSAIMELSRNEKLSSEAYLVFKTNKFLDFKNRDTLIKIIDNRIFEKTELNNYFGYKKNWDEIEKEDTTTYKKPIEENYSYSYTDSTMTQHYKYNVSQYEMSREMKVIYNSKGFIIYDEKKAYFNGNLSEMESTSNIFDDRNRVIKIIKRTERKNKVENKETIIDVEYKDNTVKVTSVNGIVLCKFTTNDNSIGFISKLNPRDTVDNFMYSLQNQKLNFAKEYCTIKMIQKLETNPILNHPIEDLNFKGGSSKFSEEKGIIKDIWEIQFSTNKKEKYNVDFVLIKQKNGWKIDEFNIYK